MDSHVLMNGWVWFRWPEQPGDRIATICVNIAHVSAVAGLEDKDRTALFMSSGEKHIIPNASPSEVALQLMCAKLYVDGTVEREREDEQRAASDLEDVQEFIADCTVESSGSIDNRAVYSAYRKWATEYGLQVRSHKWLSQHLRELGYEQDASRTNGRRWRGFLLNSR